MRFDLCRRTRLLFVGTSLCAGLSLATVSLAQSTLFAPAPDHWAFEAAGDNLDQLEHFERILGLAGNGSVVAAGGEQVLRLSANQELRTRHEQPRPARVAIAQRVHITNSAGAAGLGFGTRGQAGYYVALINDGSDLVLLRKNTGAGEVTVGQASFNPANTPRDLALEAEFLANGSVALRVLVDGAPRVTATDAAPPAFGERIELRFQTRNGALADFAHMSRLADTPAETRDALPAGAFVNVKSYGAVGDGVADDTASIRAAIAARLGRERGLATIYFPNGTYKVSDTLAWKYADGSWGTSLVFQGESREGAVIRLADGAGGFGSALTPKALIATGSALAGTPTGGGKDWTNKGEGNNAFYNSVLDLTLDTGSGNAGAVALDFLSSNMGAVRNVVIRSGDGAGAVGLALNRKWSGPSLVKHVSIQGFAFGVDVAESMYAHTLENVTLAGQTSAGLRLRGRAAIAARHLVSHNSVPAVLHESGAGGLLTLLDSTLAGGPGAAGGGAAIRVTGTNAGLFVRDVAGSGYARLVEHAAAPTSGAALREFATATHALHADSVDRSLRLPVREAPIFSEPSTGGVVDVRAYGANPDDALDDTAAIQAAIDACAPGGGLTTVYLSPAANSGGAYRVRSTLVWRGGARKLQGNWQTLAAEGAGFEDLAMAQPVIRVESGGADAVFFERLLVDRVNLTQTPLSIEHAGAAPLVIRHAEIPSYRSTPASGALHLEDVTSHNWFSSWRFEHPQDVWARQFNPEDFFRTKVFARGARLWILGMKTERPSVALHATAGARVELFGGLLHNSVHASPAGLPAVVLQDAALAGSFATDGLPGLNYAVAVEETRGLETRQLLPAAAPRQVADEALLPRYIGAPTAAAANTPLVRVEAVAPTASEGGASGVLRFTRTGSTAGAVSVSFTRAGSASPGADHAALPASVTIADGAASADLVINASDDGAAETAETVSVYLADGAGYRVGWPAAATVTVLDNDSPTTVPTADLILDLNASGPMELVEPAPGVFAVASWLDASGRGNHAAMPEALRWPAWEPAGAGFGGAPSVSFANQEFLLLPATADLQRADVLRRTALFALRTGADVTTRQLVWEQGSDGRGFSVYVSGGRLYAGGWSNNPVWTSFHSAPVSADSDYTIELALDAPASGTTGTFSAWLNGEPIGTMNAAGKVIVQGDRSGLGMKQEGRARFHDGVSGIDTWFPWTGELRRVLMWNRPLTAQERADLQTLFFPPPPVPALVLTAQDIGAVAAAGSTTQTGAAAFTVAGSGADIYNKADEFHYAWTPLQGDGEIVARVASFSGSHTWAKAGVMLRETLAANSKQAICLVSIGQGVAFQRRMSTGGSSSTTTTGGIAAPRWVKLVRVGDVFTAYHSQDGTAWNLLGSATIPMAGTIHAGLAVTSHQDGQLATAQFDQVAVVD